MLDMNATIAIPHENGRIFQHFGKAAQFKIYTIENGEVVATRIEDVGGVGHEELGLWLVQRGVAAVVCGNVGPGAQGALTAAGIALLAGVEGPADDAIAKLLAGTLVASGSANCGHSPGEGGCGGGCGHCHGRCHG